MTTVEVEVPDLSTVRRIIGEWLQRRNAELDAQEFACKIITVINGKGGVGKTTYAVNWAAYLASVGKRVLYVELDPQGNACEDLGINKTDLDDGGRAQLEAVLNQKPFQPTGQARPNLWIVPGGPELAKLVTEMHFLKKLAGLGLDLPWQYLYLCSLEQCQEEYDVIVLDVAPGDEALQFNALQVADGLIVPTRTDPSSRKGLRIVAERMLQVQETNEVVDLLGIVLFATNSSATKVQDQLREDLAKELGSAADKVVPHAIRYVESAAVELRRRGMTPYELIKKRPKDVPLKSIEQLESDYSTVNTALLRAVVALNAELNTPED